MKEIRILMWKYALRHGQLAVVDKACCCVVFNCCDREERWHQNRHGQLGDIRHICNKK